MSRALIALVALLLALPAAAVGQAPQTNAPPGNSAIDEYLETVPGATGNTAPGPPSQTGGGSGLTAAERARLEALGPDGKALAKAVDETSPAAPGKTRAADKTAPKSEGRSPLREVVGTVTEGDGGNGMGFVLPAILLGTLLAVLLLVLLRRRAAS